MDPRLSAAIGRRCGAEVASWAELSGGDINVAYRVDLTSGRRIFVKSHPRAPSGMFSVEARGLAWLGEANTLRVPEVDTVSEGGPDEPPFLALEYLDPAPPCRGFDEVLGRGLADLHRFGAPCFGLDHDNFVGSLAQANEPRPDWATFYRDQRIAPLVARAARRGLFEAKALSDFDRLLGRLGPLVGPAEPPSRLHGDLWSGNLHTDEQGRPCLIDPAVYGGHREIDLAMMRLFGGFGAKVFAAYEEAWPLAAGHEARVPLYQLLPLLVHVNLFGASYVEGATRALVAALSV